MFCVVHHCDTSAHLMVTNPNSVNADDMTLTAFYHSVNRAFVTIAVQTLRALRTYDFSILRQQTKCYKSELIDC